MLTLLVASLLLQVMLNSKVKDFFCWILPLLCIDTFVFNIF